MGSRTLINGGLVSRGLVSGTKPLCPVELSELGPLVEGKSLLHLQCHFGIDTLNWARLGARVTGLDFSAPAIEAARRLSEESGVPGRFVQANVYDAPAALDGERFEVVYTGIGALIWLPDVRAWARVVASCLLDGGRLYVYEGHPVLWSLGEEVADEKLELRYRYFEAHDPTVNDEDTTYVDGPKLEVTRNYEWNHGLGEIVTALIDAGLRIDFLHEHREVPWQALPWMEHTSTAVSGADVEVVDGERDPSAGARYQSDRLWRLPEAQRELVPLMYSLLATKVPEVEARSRHGQT